MQREIFFDKFDQFLDEIRNVGIKKIAIAETNEKRAMEVERDVVKVVSIIKMELLAYRDSTIYKCVLNDIDVKSVRDDLESKGFETNIKSRNII